MFKYKVGYEARPRTNTEAYFELHYREVEAGNPHEAFARALDALLTEGFETRFPVSAERTHHVNPRPKTEEAVPRP